MLMAMRRLDAAEADDSFTWMRAGSRSRRWSGSASYRAFTQGEDRGYPAARLMIYTLMSSGGHRILTIEPERSAVGEHGRSQTASGASILQDGQSVSRRPTAFEPDRPGTATECSLCAPTTA